MLGPGPEPPPGAPMTRDELTVALAVKAKMITEAQVEDARKLQGLLLQNGFNLTLPEILLRKDFLNADQARLLNVAVRYEEIREDDLALGAFLVKKGFLSEEKVRECLAQQDQPYREGKVFPRLRDLIVEKNYFTAQQVYVVLRARQQFDPAARPPSGPLPAVGPPRPPSGLHAIPPPDRPEPPPDPRKKSEMRILARPESSTRIPITLGPEEVEAGIATDHLRVSYRKSRARDGAGGETSIPVLDLEGSIDAHTFKKFDHYLTAAIDHKGPRMVLNCEKLDYVSSAGIGVLAGATKRCRDRQGDLRLCCVNEKVKKIVNLVGLQALLRTYEGERGALMSFKFM